jgi:predicted amidohydrolase
MTRAAGDGAHILHTSEAALTGYPGVDRPDLKDYDWNALRMETDLLRNHARKHKIYLCLGSAHFLDDDLKPTNCLYLFGTDGQVVDRYDKCFLTGWERLEDMHPDDQAVARQTNPHIPISNLTFPCFDFAHYTPGDRLVTTVINGVKIGFSICYDACWPQLYAAYGRLGVKLMMSSFHSANQRQKAQVFYRIIENQVTTRCADYRMWSVCNNSSTPESFWGSFVARPDTTIPKQLKANRPGMLLYEFPDKEALWFPNYRPMTVRDDEIMHLGAAVDHPRRLNGQAEP